MSDIYKCIVILYNCIIGLMISNDDLESIVEEREKEVLGFEMINMSLYL